MYRVGFEPMTLVFKQAKTVHALDRAATLIGLQKNELCNFVIWPVSWRESVFERSTNTAISYITNSNYGGMSEIVKARHDTTRTQKTNGPRYCHGTRDMVTHGNSLRFSRFLLLFRLRLSKKKRNHVWSIQSIL
jgi:hypothetical protein